MRVSGPVMVDAGQIAGTKKPATRLALVGLLGRYSDGSIRLESQKNAAMNNRAPIALHISCLSFIKSLPSLSVWTYWPSLPCRHVMGYKLIRAYHSHQNMRHNRHTEAFGPLLSTPDRALRQLPFYRLPDRYPRARAASTSAGLSALAITSCAQSGEIVRHW